MTEPENEDSSSWKPVSYPHHRVSWLSLEKQVLRPRPAGGSPCLGVELEVTHTLPGPLLLTWIGLLSPGFMFCCFLGSLLLVWGPCLSQCAQTSGEDKVAALASVQGSAFSQAVKSRSGYQGELGWRAYVCLGVWSVGQYFAMRTNIRGLTAGNVTVVLLDCPRSLSKLMKARWT